MQIHMDLKYVMHVYVVCVHVCDCGLVIATRKALVVTNNDFGIWRTWELYTYLFLPTYVATYIVHLTHIVL